MEDNRKDTLQDQPEFSLEDILKEFGDFSDTEDQSTKEEQKVPEAEEAAEKEKSSVSADTVRLNEISQAVQEAQKAASAQPEEEKRPEAEEADTAEKPLPPVSETPAEESAAVDSGATVRFTPVGKENQEDQELPPPIPAPEEKVEPYSEEWEPEYEQPMGEYIPPQPIVFRPKSRLWELKKKLVEGPERRYYELSEQGVGKLQAAIFLNLLVTLLAVGSAVMFALGMVRPERIRLMAFGQFFALLMSALLGSYQLMEGVGDLLRKRFTLNTLLVFSFAASAADCLMCLKQVRVPCCAAFSLNVSMSLLSALQKRNTEIGQMDTMRKAIRLDSVSVSENFYENRPGFLRGEGQVEDFMDTCYQPSAPEKVVSVYALVSVFVSLAIGLTAGIMHSWHMGIQFFCAGLLVAVPGTGYVALSRPAALLERRLHKLGTVICGWQGIQGLSRPGVFPLTDTDLFPAGFAKMNGVKFYGSRKPDDVVAYATALISADGGSLMPLFVQLLDSRNGIHYDLDEFRSYENGGIGGAVNGEAVLAGTLSFMQSMGVEMPEGTKVNQAVYVAIDGALCGVFAISYAKVKASATGLTTLCAYRKLTPVMTTCDFMLTESFIRSKFGVNTRRIAFPNRETRAELAGREAEENAPALALTTKEGLAGAAYAVTGARALRSSQITGIVIHMLGGILGMLIVLALAVVGADHLMTGMNILLYELIWMIPGLLITEWTRSV